MTEGDWYLVKEQFENSLYEFVKAIKEDGRDLEDELSESLKGVIDDRDIDIAIY